MVAARGQTRSSRPLKTRSAEALQVGEIDLTGEHPAAGEQRGRGHDTRPDARLEVAAHAGANRLAAAVVRRSARDRAAAPGRGPRGVGPPAAPGRRTAGRASPRSGPARRPPRPRTRRPRRADGSSGSGSAGTRGGGWRRSSLTLSAAQNGHSKSAYSITSDAPPARGRGLRSGDGSRRASSRSPAGHRGLARETVEDQVRARQLARGRRLVAPLDDPVGTDDHERALGEAAPRGRRRTRGTSRPWARSPRAARS